MGDLILTALALPFPPTTKDADFFLLFVCESIREFCDLSMPILMFDKDENYCVLRLQEVSVIWSPV